MPGVEGLHGPTKYNSLAESGAVLDPHIICKDLGDCPTGDAVQPRSGRGGRRFKSCHSDQLSRKSAGFRHSFGLCGAAFCQDQAARRDLRLGLGTQQLDATPLAPDLS